MIASQYDQYQSAEMPFIWVERLQWLKRALVMPEIMFPKKFSVKNLEDENKKPITFEVNIIYQKKVFLFPLFFMDILLKEKKKILSNPLTDRIEKLSETKHIILDEKSLFNSLKAFLKYEITNPECEP